MKVGSTLAIVSMLYDYELVRVTDPTSVQITITDPDGHTVVSGENMTLIESGKYEGSFRYFWQSSGSDTLGVYSATITAVYGGYTSIQEISELVELE